MLWMSFAKRSLLWLLSAVYIAPVVWGITTSLSIVLGLVDQMAWSRSFLDYAYEGVFWSAGLVLMLAPFYGVVLFAWPLVTRIVPRVESTRAGLALSAAALSLPTALAVGRSVLRVLR
jgi:hypothetical protein